MTEPKILIYDIENTPNLGWVWEKWKTNVIAVERHWNILCFAYKWLGEKQIKTVAMPDFKMYDKHPDDDIAVATELWHLHDEADIVIAHNGNRFDQLKANARFLVHGFPPPSPYREIDTLQVARKRFKFTANNLDELCAQLGIGRKEATTGWRTWKGCIEGDPKAWATMLKYNKQDVALLEELYLKMRPWMTTHPNLALMSDRPDACPKCGVEGRMMMRNKNKFYGVTRSQVWQCLACSSYSSFRISEKFRPTYK